eukprot:scaffold280849_cov22-Tisochrysis_lutea.AAC.1
MALHARVSLRTPCMRTCTRQSKRRGNEEALMRPKWGTRRRASRVEGSEENRPLRLPVRGTCWCGCISGCEYGCGH